ncbi:hypothetical protein [Streptomyces jumonjinensis]
MRSTPNPGIKAESKVTLVPDAQGLPLYAGPLGLVPRGPARPGLG